MPTPPPGVFTTEQALAAGYTPVQIRYRVQQGRWRRLHPRVLCTAETFERHQHDATARHLLEVAGAQAALAAPSWASHESAAVLHRLALPAGQPKRVVLTQECSSSHQRAYPGVTVRQAAVPVVDRTTVADLPVTRPARTVLDLARTLPLTDAVVVGDSALHQGLVTRSQLHAAADRCAGWPSIQRARTAVAHMDGRRETPLESRSWMMFVDFDLPLPEPQVEIVDEDGYVIARVDYLWRARGVIGEADGAIKYRTATLPDQPSALLLEKRRQEALEALGFVVVRWDWRDVVRQPERTCARIRAALARGSLAGRSSA